jgi:hypothetical protein
MTELCFTSCVIRHKLVNFLLLAQLNFLAFLSPPINFLVNFLSVRNAPQPQPLRPTRQPNILVRPSGNPKTLHKFLNWLDHARPVLPVRPFHFSNNEFSLGILILKLFVLQLLCDQARRGLILFVHARGFNLDLQICLGVTHLWALLVRCYLALRLRFV